VQPEPNHVPPRIIVIGKPHAINMASLPKTAGQSAYQVLGLSRQLDIIIEQNHRLHSLVQTIIPPTPPTTNNLTQGRLVTRIKRSSAGNNEAGSSTHWSTSPVIPQYPTHTTPEQPLIITDDVVSSTESSDNEGENVTTIKQRRPTTPVPRPDVA
jgi:hypothetical protein